MNIESKLFKRGKYYYITLNTPLGPRRLSTKCTTMEEAVASVRSSGIGEMSDAAKTVRLTHQAIGSLVSGNRISTEIALEKYLEYLTVHSSGRTSYLYESLIKQWMSFSVLNKKPVSAVDEADISAFVNDPASPVKAKSRSFRLAVIRLFMDYCLNNGWCYRRPAALVKVNYRILSHEQKEPRRQIAYTEAEARTLVKAIQERMLSCSTNEAGQEKREKLEFWQAAIIISFYTGLRLCDVASLEWASFSQPGEIIVHTLKRNKRVDPSLHPDVMATVNALPKRDPKYLFPKQQYVVNIQTIRYHLSTDFQMVCKSLNQPYYGFHSFRRGHATMRAKRGETLVDIAKDLGHSSTETTRGYVL